MDGDYVIFPSHATLKEEDRGNDQKGMNIIDTWRIAHSRHRVLDDARTPLVFDIITHDGGLAQMFEKISHPHGAQKP